MTKIEKLKEALAKATPSDQPMESTGVVMCSWRDGGMDYHLRSCEPPSNGKNCPYIEFATLAHNNMPQLLDAVERLAEVTDHLAQWYEAAGSPPHGTELALADAEALLEKLK